MSKQTLSKLIVQRSAHRKTTTKLLEKIEEAKEFGKCGAEFMKIFETLEAKWSILETLNEKIVSLMDVEGMEDEIVETDEYSLELSIRLHKLKEFQQTETATSQLPEQNRLPTERALESANSIENQQSSVNQTRELVREDNQPTVSNGSLYSSMSQSHKLPKLVLPTFDGCVLQWQTFWDIFETSVHFNPTLSEIQKFSYLKSQLEGVAAMTIEGFSLTNANYSRAVDLLRERYGQPHKIIQSTMQALLQLPTPSLTIPSLRNFHDRMESYIRGLESLNQCQETYGSLLVPILLEKLPGEIRRNIARENEKNDWTLACLRKVINKEINILEAGQCNRVELESQNATAIFHAGTKNKTKDSVDRNKGPKPSIKCAYCNKDHRSFQCKKFATFESRMGEVKKNKLCFNCLGNHQLAECQSKRTCRFCDKKHHSSICAKNPAFQTNNVNSHGTAMMYANNDKPDILLKTAVAEVQSSSCSMYANILFDEGAQRSFITQKLADELNVTRRGADSVRLAAFGGKEQDLTHQHLDRAEIQLITDSDEKLKLDVLIIPTIAVPLQTRAQSRAAELPYLKGLKLAHPVTSDSEFEISLLIGVDQYWKIVEDRVIRGNGPTSLGTNARETTVSVK